MIQYSGVATLDSRCPGGFLFKWYQYKMYEGVSYLFHPINTIYINICTCRYTICREIRTYTLLYPMSSCLNNMQSWISIIWMFCKIHNTIPKEYTIIFNLIKKYLKKRTINYNFFSIELIRIQTSWILLNANDRTAKLVNLQFSKLTILWAQQKFPILKLASLLNDLSIFLNSCILWRGSTGGSFSIILENIELRYY